MCSPLVRRHLFQPPSSIIITQLYVTIHDRPLCAASMYCLYTSVSDMWALIMLFFMLWITGETGDIYQSTGLIHIKI